MALSPNNPHDMFFKRLWSQIEVARGFFDRYLPAEVKAELALDTLTLSKDSFVDESMAAHHSDLLYEVQTRNHSTEAEKAYLYLLFEHKSYIDEWTSLQVLDYKVQICQKERLQRKKPPLPPVIPLVLYHGDRQWQVATEFSDLIAAPDALMRYVPKFNYQLCDLNHDQLDLLQNQALLAVALQVLKYSRSGELPARLPNIFRLFQDLFEQRDNALIHLQTVLRYLAQVSGKLNESTLQTALLEALPIEIGDQLMPTLAETWHEQGLQKGILQGREEGREEGILIAERQTYVRQTRLRFGNVTADRLTLLLEQVDKPKQLMQIGDWIIQCRSGEILLKQVQDLLKMH